MPRFAVLRHETPPGYPRPAHYDLLLEWGRSLRTWALAEWPAAGGVTAAEELPPHRREYLDYEGEVSAGRGSVTRVAAGEYRLSKERPDFVQLSLVSPGGTRSVELSRQTPGNATWTVILSAAENKGHSPPPQMLDTRRRT